MWTTGRRSSAFASTVLTAIVTVIGTVWVARSRTKLDLGASITSGFRELTDQLQEERGHLNDIILRQRGELVAAEKENARLDAETRKMRRRIALLEGTLSDAGFKVPRRPTRSRTLPRDQLEMGAGL